MWQIKSLIFTIIDEDMSEMDYQHKVDEIMQNRFSDFDPIEDLEVLAQQENFCIVRTRKLMPTLFFMQRAWWKIWSLEPDDEYDKYGIRYEYNILTYYKPKKWN